MATLIRVTGDFDVAEEAVQEAFVVALERWPHEGVPENPGAWITQVARNKAIDRIRRAGVLRDKVAALERLEMMRAEAEAGPGERLGEIEDDRLRLIFTCCHPALGAEARVAADPAQSRQAQHRRDRSRLPQQRECYGAADRPRQAQDRRQQHPL